MKAKLIDYQSYGSFHEMFNASFMLMCSSIFEMVDMTTGYKSYENQVRLCRDLNIPYPANLKAKQCNVIEKDSGSANIQRFIIAACRWLRDFVTLPKDTYLITNYTNPFALPIILVLNRLWRKKIVITLHGELELIEKPTESRLRPSHWYAKIYRVCLNHLLEKSNVKVLVLGHGIRENILSHFPHIAQNVIAINHPYIFPDKQESHIHNDVLTLGILGRMDEKKGLNDLIKLADHLSSKHDNPRVIIRSIGARPVGFDTTRHANIEWSPEFGLSRSEYATSIEKVDYILMLYPVNSYRYTASGIAMDALCYKKPIIGYRNSYVDAMFKSDKIGYLADTFEELTDIIEKVIASRPDISIFAESIINCRKRFSIEYNAKLLKEALK